MKPTNPGAESTVRLVPVPRPAPEASGGTRALSLVRAQPSPDPRAWAQREPDEPPVPTDLERLPDPRRWTALIAQAVVEILAGRRPPGQVVRWVDPEIYERIVRSAPARRPGAPAGRSGAAPVRVRRVRVSTTPDGTVEAVAVVDDGVRCRALAVRLEALSRRWMCTALEVV